MTYQSMSVDDLNKIMFNPPPAEWLTERRTFLGASDMAAIMGLHPYRTELQVWLEKTGQAAPEPPNERMVHGQNLEEYIARCYTALTGREVVRSRLYRHPDYDFIGATPDYQCVKEKRLLECKTAGVFAAREFGLEADAVPDWQLVQCMTQMVCTGAQNVDLMVLIGGNELRLYPIERDEALINTIIERAVTWWHDHILSENAPPLSGHPNDTAYINRRYTTSNTDVIYARPEIDEVCVQLRDLLAINAANEREAARLANLIKEEMGEAGTLYCSVGEIRWQTNAAGRRPFCPHFKEVSSVRR